MVLKFRCRLGLESLCAGAGGSISWRGLCRIPLDERVAHPATLMKLAARCGEDAVAGLNEVRWAKAAGARLLRTARVRADTTVIGANAACPTDSGLLATAVGKLVGETAGQQARLRMELAGLLLDLVLPGRGFMPGATPAQA
jgi:IS5 family transposase